MRTNRYLISAASAVAILSASCSDEFHSGDISQDDAPGLSLQARIEQVNETRADDSGFADGDRIGIYVVNYNGSNPGQLLASGNHATNVRFTFDAPGNSWNGDREIYFKDDDTHVDVYGVYPYSPVIDNVEAYEFSVEKDQGATPDNSMSAYEASDLLWGKTGDISPEDGVITVVFNHILAGVSVTLLEGNGFADGEWSSLEKSAFIGSTVRDAKVNLSTGEATPSGEDDGRLITAVRKGDGFRAVVVPQTVAAGKGLVRVIVGEKSYELVKDEAMTFIPGKLHKFTITVNKALEKGDYEFSLIQEAITAWESDAVSHNGELREYISVVVPEYGGLEAAVKEAGLNPSNILNLKISGKMDESDFYYLRANVGNLEAINLAEATVTGRLWDANHIYGDDFHVELVNAYEYKEYTLPYNAFDGMKYLRYVTLPDKLKAIGDNAFGRTSLTGSLRLPEGLEYIGNGAFGEANDDDYGKKSLSGELYLPSTLKYIMSNAFTKLDLSGELNFPSGLKYIGDAAFARCHYFKGKLHLPTDIEYVGSASFYRVLGLGGEFRYPHSETVVRAILGGTKIESVILPEAPVEIDGGAFDGVPLTGDFLIPASVRKIGNNAFCSTKLSHIYFAGNIGIDKIPIRMFAYSTSLIDTITIPDKVEIIEEYAFQGCEKLDAIVLPKSLQRIGTGAFAGCSSLTYLRCDATEVPEVPENAFEGINKDNFTVVVPEGCEDKYRAADGWKEFKRFAVYKNFVARPMKYNLLNKGGEREIVLNADAEWEMAEKPDWCALDVTSGNKKTSIKLTVSEMAHNAGDRNGKIVFKLKGSDYTTSVTVGQYDYEHEEDATIELNNSTKGSGINLYFVGDGYDAIDISSGKMLQEMKEEMEALFAVEPYKTYRDYFNVYCGVALSDDSGIEDVNHWRNTKFHTVLSNSDTRLEADYQAASTYASDRLNAHSGTNVSSGKPLGVVLVANTPIYEGICYSSGDNFCAVVTRSEFDAPNDYKGIIQHEVGGHGIGWLADEYKYHNSFIQNCTCSCCRHVAELEGDHANGFGLNVSLNGKFRQVPWYHLITNPSYSDIVDVYEGGYFHAKGVYRSEYNSCMNNNVPYYSTWSRQLIVQRIMKLAGEEFSLDKFYENDKRGEDYLYGTRSLGIPTEPIKHGHPPVFVKDLFSAKKGGRK